MNKHGIIDETWLFLFYRFIIVCLVALAMVLLVKTYIVTNIDIQKTHAELFRYDFLNMKEGISYYDTELQRVYPGIIPLSSFNSNIDEKFSYGNHALIAAELHLFTTTGENKGIIYYNKEWYDRWIILVRTSWTGLGAATEYVKNTTVLIRYEDGTTEPGILQFSIVMPNS
ncbi:MAG: hypothetical protein WC254_02175 [Candidatus Woesearchaeota archaeon]|jgi:hypothetical protein